MYVLASDLKSLPVISLQTGQPVAQTSQLVIEPSNLEVVAFACQPTNQFKQPILPTRDIRQLGSSGVLIDSADELAETDDIVRIRNLAERRFKLGGILVCTDLGRRIGRIDDFTVSLDDYKVQKLHVRQSILKSLMLNHVIVDRSQIVDVSDKQITVRDTVVSEKATMPRAVMPPVAEQ